MCGRCRKQAASSPFVLLLEDLSLPSRDAENAVDHVLPENVFRGSGHSQDSFPKPHHVHVVIQRVSVVVHCQNRAFLVKLEHVLYHGSRLDRVHRFLVYVSGMKALQLETGAFESKFRGSGFRAETPELFVTSRKSGGFGALDTGVDRLVFEQVLAIQGSGSRMNSSNGIKPLKLPSQLSDEVQSSLSETETNRGESER